MLLDCMFLSVSVEDSHLIMQQNRLFATVEYSRKIIQRTRILCLFSVMEVYPPIDCCLDVVNVSFPSSSQVMVLLLLNADSRARVLNRVYGPQGGPWGSDKNWYCFCHKNECFRLFTLKFNSALCISYMYEIIKFQWIKYITHIACKVVFNFHQILKRVRDAKRLRTIALEYRCFCLILDVNHWSCVIFILMVPNCFHSVAPDQYIITASFSDSQLFRFIYY